MSLPPHREKDAKAEGRGRPETVKETMAPFRSLMGRILKVPMIEVKEQQRLYEEGLHGDQVLDLSKVKRKKLLPSIEKQPAPNTIKPRS